MDSQEIKIILEKYYRGETSLEEEKILRAHFGQQLPAVGDIADKRMVNYFDSEKTSMPVNFTLELDNLVENEWKKDSKRRFVKFVKWGSSVAAVLIIAIGITLFTKEKTPVYADTCKTPEEAYMETQKVLLFISNTMDKKAGKLKYLSTVDHSLKQCSKLSKINERLNSVKNENN